MNPRGREALIDAIVVLSGLVLLLLMGYTHDTLLVNLLQALGTSLVAAGMVTFLIRKVMTAPQQDNARIEMVSDNRIDLENEYIRLKYVAHELDIVSIALAGALEEMALDASERILKRVLFNRAKIRLMFVSPLADYAKQRATEDGVSLSELEAALRSSVIRCVEIYNRLQRLFENATASHTFNRDQMGALEIRLIDMCPHFTIYRTDGNILWGIYTSAQRGFFSSVLRVKQEQGALYAQLTSHFDRLWDKNLGSRTSGDNYLLRFYGPSAPMINGELVARVLGHDWRERYGGLPSH